MIDGTVRNALLKEQDAWEALMESAGWRALVNLASDRMFAIHDDLEHVNADARGLGLLQGELRGLRAVLAMPTERLSAIRSDVEKGASVE